MFFKSDPTAKAAKFELKGDRLASKGKYKKARQAYEKALACDWSRLSVYKKLISLLDAHKDDFSEEDFAYSVYWAMQIQEIEDPTFKRIHARQEPEFQEVIKLIQKMMQAKEQNEETKIVEDIASYGESAVYPLIDFLLTFKEIGRQQKS